MRMSNDTHTFTLCLLLASLTACGPAAITLTDGEGKPDDSAAPVDSAPISDDSSADDSAAPDDSSADDSAAPDDSSADDSAAPDDSGADDSASPDDSGGDDSGESCPEGPGALLAWEATCADDVWTVRYQTDADSEIRVTILDRGGYSQQLTGSGCCGEVSEDTARWRCVDSGNMNFRIEVLSAEGAALSCEQDVTAWTYGEDECPAVVPGGLSC